MKDLFTTLENVYDAANLLITIDTYSIKPEVIEDSEDFIIELQIALDNFNNPINQNTSINDSYSRRMLFDQQISALLNATKNLYNLLTEDGKETVQRFIEHKKQIRNKANNLSLHKI